MKAKIYSGWEAVGFIIIGSCLGFMLGMAVSI